LSAQSVLSDDLKRDIPVASATLEILANVSAVST
jgi:hypothetical protein